MGGYGALLYGALLNAGKIIAFSPADPEHSEVFFCKKNRSEHLNIHKKLEEKILTSGAEKLILHGDSMISDLLAYKKYNTASNSICKLLWGCGHTLAAIFAQNICLSTFVEESDTVLEYIEHIYKSFSLSSEELQILEDIFSPTDTDGISRTPKFVSKHEILHHSVLYCLGITFIESDNCLAKKYFGLSLSKHLHFRSAKKYFDLISNKIERKELLSKIEDAILKFGIAHMEMIESITLKKIYDDLISCVYPEKSVITENKAMGYVDKHDGENLFGWCITDDPTEIASVDIEFQNDVFKRQISTCNLYRSDLDAAGKNDGHCAFLVPLNVHNPLIKNSTCVYVKETKTKFHLNNSGFIIPASFIHFFVENITGDTISGWVFDRNHKEKLVEFTVSCFEECFDDNIIIERVRRGDLQAQGINILSGFKIKLGYKNHATNIINVFLKDSNYRLSRGIVLKINSH